MKLTARDKMLALVLPAALLFIGYATYGLSVWRGKIGASEKALAVTREKIPSQSEESNRRGKLAATNREIQAETKELEKLRLQPAATTAEIARERLELQAVQKKLASGDHKAATGRIEAEHKAALARLEADHKLAIARLWYHSKGPAPDRTQRIELLNKVLVRFDLSILDAADETGAEALAPRLQAVMKTAAEVEGVSPPRLRQLKLRGRYGEVADALESLARGDAWAVPLALTMKTAGDDSAMLEWTLTVWV